ncbi:MAG: DUF362 domain-containing protein [Deltaproteobacteria bacterium]|nr:DUF362 domain-containing protein [Deltaproteobacteria bacterium]MBW1986444.1 DUF362 domain-containing protein [Deltaproteobacteria bacterium]MBW2133838.1 DUF362 domain-containing protein [Deltaproteobacteria bacterium]
MNRREFLKQVAALGVLAGAGRIMTMPAELWAMAPKEKPAPILARATGTNYAHLVGDAVQALGGMKKFVNPGEVVVVKPNMAFDRPPEMAATTHPVVVRKVVELCLEAGAKKVKVLDRTCHDARRTYVNSGIKGAVEGIKDSRVVVEFVDERRFVELNIENAKALKRWSFYQDILEADRFINIPVAKTHSEARLSLCMKNMMGAIGGWRGRIHVGLQQNIADMNLVLRPDLHILDATRILTQNGPTGGKLEYVQIKNQIIAGTDPVALDAYGTTLFDLKPADIGHIVKGHELGLGEIDLKKIKFLGA